MQIIETIRDVYQKVHDFVISKEAKVVAIVVLLAVSGGYIHHKGYVSGNAAGYQRGIKEEQAREAAKPKPPVPHCPAQVRVNKRTIKKAVPVSTEKPAAKRECWGNTYFCQKMLDHGSHD